MWSHRLTGHDKTDFLFLMKCSQQLKGWTGKTNSTVVYDSKVDIFTNVGLFAKVGTNPTVLCSVF